MSKLSELIEQHGGDAIAAAKLLATSELCGDRRENEIGLGPTPATATAMNELELDHRDPNRARIFAHVLGFHDALLRDGGGYKVPDVVGKDYEDGHRAGAELMSKDGARDLLLAAPREVQP